MRVVESPPAALRRADGRQPAAPGSEAARAVAEVVRITLLDDAGREDMREHLAHRRAADRLAFAAMRVAETCPPLPAPAGMPHPGAASGTARYRAVAAAAGAARAAAAAARSTDDAPRLNLST